MKLLARRNRILANFPWEWPLLAAALLFFAWQVYHPTLALHLLGNQIFFGMSFLAVVLFVTLFTLLQYSQNKDKSYLFYSIYLFASFLYALHASGNIQWFLFGNNKALDMIAVRSFIHRFSGEFFLSLLLMVSYCLFLQQFFELKKNHPRLHRWMNFGYRVFLGYAILALAVVALDMYTIKIGTFLKFTLAVPAAYVLFFMFQIRDRLFKLILSGTTVLLAGAAASGLVSNFTKLEIYPADLGTGAIRPADAQMLYLQLGMLTEILLFSTALGYKSLLTEKEKNKALLEAAEARRLQDLDTLKTSLYTNITHEFRTPLTIILGEAERLEKSNGVHFTDRLSNGLNPAATIRRNGKQLLYLVNQLLDLAKLEAGSFPLHFQQGDVIVYLKYLLVSFQSLADAKKINLSFDSSTDSFHMDFDAEKLRQIVSNLLSNAIKFTPEGGRVMLSAVSLQSADTILQICVADSGMGIPPEDLPHVFDRFFQAGNPAANFHPGGTGIGLTLTHELVKLLGGTIDVKSQLGKGTTFTTRLPVSRNAPAAQEFVPVIPAPRPPLALTPEPDHPQQRRAEGLPQLLLIEDNEDVLCYLSSILNNEYRLETAANGKQGLEKALRIIPDIILSDVMMPEMDGYEICRLLKKDLRTSHVPVVLLTAKADFDSRLEGLERGAEAYLAKPFEARELEIVLRKVLENRENLRRHYTSGDFLAPKKPVSASKNDKSEMQDEQLLKKVLAMVEKHLGDYELTAERLAGLLHLSYSTLFKKVKALTGIGVTEYVRHIRLHRAAQLLAEQPEVSVTQISLAVGFNNLHFFSREFKKIMGFSPTEWRQKQPMAEG